MTINNQTKLARQIECLNDVIYDTLTLERERLTQLSKLIDTVISDLNRYPTQPAYCIEQAGITLGIAQMLLDDFHYQTDSEVKALEGKA